MKPRKLPQGAPRDSKYKVVVFSLPINAVFCPSDIANFAEQHGFLELIHPDLSLSVARQRLRIAMGLYRRRFDATNTTCKWIRNRLYRAWPSWVWCGFANKLDAIRHAAQNLLPVVGVLKKGTRYSTEELLELWSMLPIVGPGKAFMKGRENNWEQDWRSLNQMQMRFMLDSLAEYWGLQIEKSYTAELWRRYCQEVGLKT